MEGREGRGGEGHRGGGGTGKHRSKNLGKPARQLQGVLLKICILSTQTSTKKKNTFDKITFYYYLQL
jgi:hypothetical protein